MLEMLPDTYSMGAEEDFDLCADANSPDRQALKSLCEEVERTLEEEDALEILGEFLADA